MKFNNVLNEGPIVAPSKNPAANAAVANFVAAQKGQSSSQPVKSVGSDFIKIELGGQDTVHTGTKFGDTSTLIVKSAYVNNQRININGKIRFVSGAEAQSDAIAVAQSINRFDKNFHAKFAEVCANIARNRMAHKYAPTNMVWDITYNASTGTITTTPDV